MITQGNASLVTNCCCCGSGKQVCQHTQLARHNAACGNNPENGQATMSCGFCLQAVYAAQQAGFVTDQNVRQQPQDFNTMLKDSGHFHPDLLVAMTNLVATYSALFRQL